MALCSFILKYIMKKKMKYTRIFYEATQTDNLNYFSLHSEEKTENYRELTHENLLQIFEIRCNTKTVKIQRT